MKRSKRIRLLLLGSVSATTITGCGPKKLDPAPVTTDTVFTNNHYIPGVGYYHAPFRAWYHLPYNYNNSGNNTYFAGGQWRPEPYESITNISAPIASEASAAEQKRSDIHRGGFGSTSRSHSIWS